MADYRAIERQEWDEAMALWVRVFGVGGWLFQSLNDATTDRKLMHTRVAVEGGKIVSAVDVFMRELRDQHGLPAKVGAIGSVATDAEARKQGHSGKLLLDEIQVMRDEGCVWSFLFTGTHTHYEKYGWFRTVFHDRSGTVSDQPIAHDGYEVRTLSADTGWPLQEMAAIYDAFNYRRPLSHVRTKLYWEKAIQVRLELPECRVLGAYSRGQLVAYAVYLPREGQVVWGETAFLDGHASAIHALAESIRTEALAAEISAIRISLPFDEKLDPVISKLVVDMKVGDQGWAMARPIAEGMTQKDVEAILYAPGAHNWELDAF